MIVRATIVIIAVVFSMRCSPDKKFIDYQKLKKATETSTGYFDPGFINDTHQTAVFKIRDYEIYDSLISGHGFPVKYRRTVTGKMPSMRSGGTFEVVFLHADTVVSSYRMTSPLYHRVEHGTRKGLFRVKAGSFEVPVPDTLNIETIILKDNGVEKFRTRFN